MFVIVLAHVLTSVLPSDGPNMAWSTPTASIVVIGDSLSEGAHQTTSWPSLLNDELGGVNNLAVSGSGSDECLAQWEHARELNTADIVIVWCGVNDLRKGKDAAFIEQRLDRIYEEAQQDKVHVVFATIAPWAHYENWSADKQVETDKLNDWFSMLPGVSVVDVFNSFQGVLSKELDVGDGLHMNDKGAGILESLFVNGLKR